MPVTSSEPSVHARFAAQARATPDAVAVTQGSRSVSYRELDALSARLAARLRAAGVKPGDFVAIELTRSIELVVALLATLRAGAAYWPLEENLPAERRALLLADASPRLILTPADLVIESAPEDAPAPAPSPVADNAPAYLLYTSGSTGLPKGVLVPHHAILHLVRDTDYAQLRPDDVVAQAANPAFDAATFEIWGALLNGARLVILPADTVLSPARLAEAIARERITALFLTTALFNQVAADHPSAFAPLRHLLFGGEACHPDHVRRVVAAAPATRVLHVYGPTETTTFATWHHVRQVPPGAATVPIGRPLARTTLHVLDPELRPLPPGHEGEIWIGGPGVALGYHRRPELTAQRFIPDPFSTEPDARLYRTGDLGRLLPDGDLVILGRLDGQVKLRGQRIELGEIETALRALPVVAQAVVLLREDRPGDPRLAAYLTPSDPARPPAPATLRAELSRTLPAYMLPASFTTLPVLPLNANGKIDRRALPAPSEAPSHEDPAHARHAGNVLEKILLSIWREVLGKPELGMNSDFFAHGGHSLLAARAATLIEREINRPLPPSELIHAPTPESLAQRIVDTPAESSLVLLRDAGPGPALFCVHGIGGDIFSFIPLSRAFAPGLTVYGVQHKSVDGRLQLPPDTRTLGENYARDIIAARPEGPVHILGFSIGGWNAYAVADALLRAGRPLGKVVIMDTNDAVRFPPWLLAFNHLVATPRTLRFHYHHRALYLARLRALDLRALALKPWQLLQKRLRPAPPRPIGPPTTRISPDGTYSKGPAEYYHGLALRYRPSRIKADLLLISSTDTRLHELLFWWLLARGRVRYHHFAKTHYEFIDPANAPALARLIETELHRPR
jgi:amino acid adenylation domain-containing protein